MPRYKYLVHHLQVSQAADFIPFTIDLPNDVAEVVGVAISNNARVNVAGGSSVATTIIGDLPARINEAQLKYNRTNVLLGKFRYQVAGFPYPEVWEELPLNRFALGAISLRSYEKSGLFYSQSVLPSRFVLSFSTEFGGQAKGSFNYRTFDNKRRIFIPVRIEGSSTELSGFFEPFAFGKVIQQAAGKSASELAESDFTEPYQVSIYLKCTLK